MDQKLKKTPPRLDTVFQLDMPPLYLVTLCTLMRRPILACTAVHDAFRSYGGAGVGLGAAVGRYVIMPDHIHAFVRIVGDMTLSRWVKGMKRQIDGALGAAGQAQVAVPGCQMQGYWQPGSFDQLLRSSDSYSEKWQYVLQNPVRSGLVARCEDWPYQGEIVAVDRA